MILRASAMLILTGLVSCSSPEENAAQVTVTDTIQNVSSDTVTKTLPAIEDTTTWPPEGILSFAVDDYPVTDRMLEPEAHFRVSGEIMDGEGAWFSNDTLNQTLVFQLYTDYHRLITYHFLNSDIPPGIIKRMELHVSRPGGGSGDLAPYELKQKYFKGFLAQSKKIGQRYFTSDKGFKLGDGKEKALKVYGKPDIKVVENGVEKYEWDFVGDIFYNDTLALKGRPFARNSFGHQTIMFFRNNKLIGLIMHNDIP